MLRKGPIAETSVALYHRLAFLATERHKIHITIVIKPINSDGDI
jgi:hypothetical protein